MPWILRARSVQGAGLALGLGLTLVWLAAWRVTHVPIPIAAQSESVDTQNVNTPTPTSGYGLDRLLSALEKDPFHPERRRPARRFELPAGPATLAARRLDDQTAATLRLIGTAVTADGGGFAMCAWQGGSPRIVRIGDHVGTWTLTRVAPGVAEFATPGGSMVVRVPKAGT